MQLNLIPTIPLCGCGCGLPLTLRDRRPRRFRKGHYVRWLIPAPEVRFWSHVKKDGPIPSHCPELGPCWIWTGGTNADGYGRIGRAGTKILAHRFSWELHNGPVPDGFHVLHHCDNPPCPNPAHLFLGTDADNVHDMLSKGRGPTGDRSGVRLHPELYCGERSSFAKLTEEQVREIRTLPGTLAAIASRFMVTAGTISMIRRGITWKSVK